MTSEGIKDEFDSYIPQQQLPYTNLVSREQYVHNYYANYLPYTTQGNISDPTASWSSNANDSIAYINPYDINPYDQFGFGFQPAYNFGYTGTGDYTTWTGIAAPQLNSIGRKTVYEEYYRDNRFSTSNMHQLGNNTNRLHDGTIPNDTLKNVENGISNLKINQHNKNENLNSKENDKDNMISSTSNKNMQNSSNNNCNISSCDYSTKKNNDSNSDNNNNNNNCNNNNENNNNDNNEQNNSSNNATQNKSWASVVSAPLSSSSSTTSSSSVIMSSMNSHFKKPYTKQNFSNQSQVPRIPSSNPMIVQTSNSRQISADFQNPNIINHVQSQNNTLNNNNLMNAYFYRHYNNNHSQQHGINYNHSNFTSNRLATTNQNGRGKSVIFFNNNNNNSNNTGTTSAIATTTTTTTTTNDNNNDNNNNINDNDSGSTITIDGETNSNNRNEETRSSYLNQLKSKNQYNPKEFDLVPRGARFFVIKSYSEDDVHRSIKYNIWCSTEHGNRRLDQAFREREGKGPVYLFFSVNGSGHFCGMAEMMSCVDYDSKSDVWSQDKWKGKFEVKWVYVKDVPNSQLRNIRLENNENKPVTNSRDTQEIPFEKGKQVLKVFHQFHNTTSIFDDFEHYEKRQDENFKKCDTVNNLDFQSSNKALRENSCN